MSKPSNKGFNTRDVLSISFAHLVHDIFGSFLAPLRPLLISKLGMNLTLAALLDLFQRLPSLLSPLVGIIAEHTSLRYIVIIAPAVTTISMSLLGVFSSFAVIAILLMTAGISSAVFHVPSPVMVRDVSGSRTGHGMSYYMLGGEIARTLGPLVITGAVSLWGLEGSWRLMPLGLTASLILFIRFRKMNVSEKIGNQRFATGIRHTFRRFLPFFITMTAYILFRSVLKSGLTAFLPTFLFNEMGNSLWMSNVSLAVLQLAGAAGTMMAGTLSDLTGRKSLLLIVAIATPVFTYLFLITQGILAWAMLILLGIMLFAPGPVLLALVQDQPSDKPAFLNSIYMTISFVVGTLSVLLSGIIADRIGLEATFMLSAFISLLAIPCVFFIRSPHQHQ